MDPYNVLWGVDDPAAALGSKEDQARAFNRALRELDTRIKLFISLPIESLDKMGLKEQLQAISNTPAEKD